MDHLDVVKRYWHKQLQEYVNLYYYILVIIVLYNFLNCLIGAKDPFN